MDRYGMYQFQDADTFVVRDQGLVFEPIVNGKGEKASAKRPQDIPYFGLTRDEAKALKDKLNGK